MVPVYAGLCDELVGLLVVVVHHTCLAGVQASTGHTHATAEASAASAAHTHVVGIVGIGHSHYAMVAFHNHAEQAGGVAVLGADTQVDIGHCTTIHSGTKSEVEHRRLVTVVNTGDTCQVALLIVCSDSFDDVGGQVLQGCLHISKVFLVDLDLLHLLTVDGDVTVVIDLGSRQTLHQLLHHRTLGSAEGIGVVNQRVALRLHLSHMSRCGDAFQHHSIATHRYRPHCEVAALGNLDIPGECGIAHAGKLQDVSSVSGGGNRESAVHVGNGSFYKCAVCLQQLHSYLNHCFFGVSVYKCSRDFAVLRKASHRHDGEQKKYEISFHENKNVVVLYVRRFPSPQV